MSTPPSGPPPSGPPPGPPPAGPPPAGPPPAGPPPAGPPKGPPPGVPALNLKSAKQSAKGEVQVKDAKGNVIRSTEEKWDADKKATVADKIIANEEEKAKKRRAERFKICTRGKCFEMLIYIGLVTYFIIAALMVFRHISYSYSWISFDVYDNADCNGEKTHTNMVFGSPEECQRHQGSMVLTDMAGYNGSNTGEEYFDFQCQNHFPEAYFNVYTCRDTCYWEKKRGDAYPDVEEPDYEENPDAGSCQVQYDQRALNPKNADYEDPKIAKCYQMQIKLLKLEEEDSSEFKVSVYKSKVQRYYEYFDYMDPNGDEREPPLASFACSYDAQEVLDFVDTSGEGTTSDTEAEEESRRRLISHVAREKEKIETRGGTSAWLQHIKKRRGPALRRRLDGMPTMPDTGTTSTGTGTATYDDATTGTDTTLDDPAMACATCPECAGCGAAGMEFDAADICSSMMYDMDMCEMSPECMWCENLGMCGETCEFDQCNFWMDEMMCSMDSLCSWDASKSMGKQCSSRYTATDFTSCTSDFSSDSMFISITDAIITRNSDWQYVGRAFWDWEAIPLTYKEQTCMDEPPFSGRCAWITLPGEDEAECISQEEADDLIPWDQYARELILCNFNPECNSGKNGPQFQCESTYGTNICRGCQGGSCKGFDKKLKEKASATMAGTDLTCHGDGHEKDENHPCMEPRCVGDGVRYSTDCEGQGESCYQAACPDWCKPDTVCIPTTGDHEITWDKICMNGVMYKDHFCNSSIMGFMALVGSWAAAFIAFCALRLFALPLFHRCFRKCCSCCYHDEDHVSGAFTHVLAASAAASRKASGVNLLKGLEKKARS